MLSSSKTQATLRTKCTSGSLAVHCAAVLMTSSQQQTCAETQIGKWIDGSGCMDGWRPIRSECAPGGQNGARNHVVGTKSWDNQSN